MKGYADAKRILVVQCGVVTLGDCPWGYTVCTSLDESLGTSKEGEGTPTVLSGRGQRESRLLAPFYDV